MTIRDELRNLITREIGLNPKDIRDDASIGTTEKWDSMAHITICLAVQQEYGIEMSTQDIVNSGSLAALTDLVAQRTQAPAMKASK